MRRSSCIFIAVLGLVLSAPNIWGQENATITGTVVDASEALVANAEITLTNPATGQARKAVTNSSGIYLFANVGVGRFTLEAAAKGFQKFTKTDIIVNTAQTIKQDFQLTVGSESQTITVEADALQLQSETSEVSNLISGAQVTQLATNGRNVVSLAALGMGVSNNLPAFGGVNALTSANGISFNGTRTSHNVYLLNGGELNDRGCGGCFSSLPSVDALAQFQTLDSNYGPDYGIGSGGTILMVLKSGTNKFHGSLWEFNRNEAFAANNYFTNLAGLSRPKFRLNNFGGNIGGPLFIPHIYNNARNRTFFFVNEEWRKLVQGSNPATVNTIAANNFASPNQDLAYTPPSNGTIPIVPVTTDPARLAIYSARGLTPGQPFPNNIIPRELMDQNAVRELNNGTFPRPNFGTSQYISSIPQPTNVREDVVRIDHAISTKLQLMGHYLHDAVDQNYYPPLWGNSSFPTVGTAMKNPSWSSTVKLTQSLSPSLLNETGFFFSGNTINLDPIGNYQQPSGWNATSFFPPENNFDSRMPEIQLGGPYSVTWSSSYFPWKNSYMGYQTRDDLSWNKGKHQLKFGFSWLHAVKNQQLQANTQGTAIFNNSSFSQDSYINFILGTAASFTQLEYLAGKHWVNNNYSFYVNDNWRVAPGLTLNLGLRYDGLPHAFERFNQFANFVPDLYDRSLPNPLNPDGTINPASLTTFGGRPFYLNGIREAGVNGFPRGNVQDRFYTFQPRVGFAYSPPGISNTVIRGGFGLFYERVQGNDVYNAALNPPFAFQPSATNVYFSNPNQSALTGATTSQRFPSAMTTLQYQYSPPGTAQFSLGVQRQVATSTIAVVQYVGSLGWSQSNNRGINTLPLTDTTNPSDPYGRRRGVANGSLNANLYRIFPGYSSVTQQENQSNFSYHSLQAGMRMENRHGLTFQLAYTYSHEVDVVANDLGMVSNPFNLGYDRGAGTFDRRHIFTANYIYQLPFFRNTGNAFQRSVLGGWEFSGITVAQTGAPQPITYNGVDVLGLGGGTTNRPNLVSKVTYPKTRLAWFDKSAFANPVAPWNGGTGFGNAGKDVVRLPGLLNFNLAVFKNFTFKENLNLQLRLESFNTFNHTQFNNINANTNDANFGQVTSARDPRTLQLGGKFSF
ncbi:carboxypeptidase-like regulatory domain-containing protein [Edaphobacter modestus]|uniref:Carboxypeptidase family protein n=1 Tax=Edaphobacter modestus TaxID=388466 RepID=A0A4Q7YUL7_9BACT|nr:carboxypeptidase-like regulatory domain-containing protein [Edaphobacter modestus]RZU40733.1 carboxypeptidase family protein [Edaphobacter modestus]